MKREIEREGETERKELRSKEKNEKKAKLREKE